MQEVGELFEQVAGRPAPPSPLVADELFAAGRRRHRRLRTGQATFGFLVTALVATGAAVLVQSADRPHRGPAVVAASSAPVAAPLDGRRIQLVAAADPGHLYVAQQTCPSGSCKQRVQLVGSTDGGPGWTLRGTPTELTGLVATGPDALLGVRGERTNSALLASVDGGRTWRAVRPAAAPAAEVPAGGTLVCLAAAAGADCVLQAVSPVSGTAAVLAGRPDLRLAAAIDPAAPGPAGVWWVPGTDPGSGVPAVALSTDAGRTWRTHPFTGTNCARSCPAPRLAIGPDGTAYAITGDPARVLRGTPDGTWTDLGRPSRAGEEPAWSFVTADGAEVVQVRGPHARRFVARSGGGYAPVELAGLPATVQPVRRTAGGWLYACDGDAGACYGSADGRQWHELR